MTQDDDSSEQPPPLPPVVVKSLRYPDEVRGNQVTQAAYAIAIYGLFSIIGTGTLWLRAPSSDWLVPAISVLFSVVIFGSLAFGIAKASRIAVVTALLIVVVIQIFTIVEGHLASGLLLFLIVMFYLSRGAAKIFTQRRGVDNTVSE